MSSSDRFDRRQLLALCAVILLTPALRLYPAVPVAVAGRAAWLAAFIALPPLLAYGFFLSRLIGRRQAGEGLAELSRRAVGDRAAGPVLLGMSLWLLFYTAFILRSGADRFITTIYPNSGPGVFVLGLGLLGTLAALGPVRSLVRVAKLVLPLLLGALGIVLFTALVSVSKINLLPVTWQDLPALLAAALPAIDAVMAVPILALFLLPGCPPQPGGFRALAQWLCFACALLGLIGLAVIGSFGAELTARLTRPFFYLVRNLVFFGSLERVEALVVTLWVFPDFLMVSALLHAAQHCLRLALGCDALWQGEAVTDLRRGRWWIPLCGLAAVGTALLLAPDAASLRFLSRRLIPALQLGFALLALPAVYLTGRLRKTL